MKKAEEYRRHAEECRVLARAAQNVEHRNNRSHLNIRVLLACPKCALIDEGIEVRDTIDKIKHYRSRAEELRAIAQGLFDHGQQKTCQSPAGFLFDDERAGAGGAVDAIPGASTSLVELGRVEIRARGRETDGDDERAKLYRERAQKLLTIAAELNEKSRAPLLEIAMDYLQIAAARGALSKSGRD